MGCVWARSLIELEGSIVESILEGHLHYILSAGERWISICIIYSTPSVMGLMHFVDALSASGVTAERDGEAHGVALKWNRVEGCRQIDCLIAITELINANRFKLRTQNSNKILLTTLSQRNCPAFAWIHSNYGNFLQVWVYCRHWIISGEWILWL